MTLLTSIATKIIKEQELIIGPVAWNEAKKVKDLVIDEEDHEVSLKKEDSAVVDQLIERYEKLFGKASLEVCRSAVRDIIGEMPPEQIPALLK